MPDRTTLAVAVASFPAVRVAGKLADIESAVASCQSEVEGIALLSMRIFCKHCKSRLTHTWKGFM